LSPDIFIKAIVLVKPRYCSLVSRGEVWIKVCNVKFRQSGLIKSEVTGFATKLLARLPFKKSGFEIVLMIKLAGLTNGRAILRFANS
jgi:hypothetical protein